MIEAEAERITVDDTAQLPFISLVQGETDGPHVFIATWNGEALALEQHASFQAAARAAHAVMRSLPSLDGLRLSVEPGQWALLGSMEPGPERERALGRDLVALGEFAALVGVSARTVERWRAEGRVVPVLQTPGGHARYSLEQVERVSASRGRGNWSLASRPAGTGATGSDFAFVRKAVATARLRNGWQPTARSTR